MLTLICSAETIPSMHLKTTEHLFDNRSSPRTEARVASAVQWAERMMRKIDRSLSDNLTVSLSETAARYCRDQR
jgi:hypothetical protein